MAWGGWVVRPIGAHEKNEMALFALSWDAATRRFLKIPCVCRKRYKRMCNPIHLCSTPTLRLWAAGTSLERSNQRVKASYRVHKVVGASRACSTVPAGSRA